MHAHVEEFNWDLYFQRVFKSTLVELRYHIYGFQEKIGGSVQETGSIRHWLELQIGVTELGIIEEVVQEEIRKLKANKQFSDIEVVTLQEEEMKRRFKEFVKFCYCSDDCVGMLRVDIKIELNTSIIAVIVTVPIIKFD
jgi:hypothetical protein